LHALLTLFLPKFTQFSLYCQKIFNSQPLLTQHKKQINTKTLLFPFSLNQRTKPKCWTQKFLPNQTKSHTLIFWTFSHKHKGSPAASNPNQFDGQRVWANRCNGGKKDPGWFGINVTVSSLSEFLCRGFLCVAFFEWNFLGPEVFIKNFWIKTFVLYGC
jgi:hypothetical protein